MIKNRDVLLNLIILYHSNKNIRPSEWIYLSDICDNLVCYMFDQAIILLDNWLSEQDDSGKYKNTIEKLRFYEFDKSLRFSDEYNNKTFGEIVSEMG